jgi:predicted metal-dependent hydrolase
MSETVAFGSKTIIFRLVRAQRKTLGITVTPDMEVLVKAPELAEMDQIKALVKKKAPWILKQQRFFLAFYPKLTERQYVSGETHLYLGRQYQLAVTLAANNTSKDSVKIVGKQLQVHTTDKAKVAALVKAWYVQQARIKFETLAKPLIRRFEKYAVVPQSIVLRAMPARWGSCTAKGKIILNPELVQAPRGCIEYVILHELCHLVHYNHTQAFMDLQTKEMPDWEKWKGRLEGLLA